LIIGLICVAIQAPAQVRPVGIRVSGAVMRGFLDHEALPRYLDDAVHKQIQGDVFFYIWIDETGKILSYNPVGGNPLLVAVSVEALKETRFRPYLLGGTPVKVQTQFGFHFWLEKDGTDLRGKVEYLTSFPKQLDFRSGVESQPFMLLDPR